MMQHSSLSVIFEDNVRTGLFMSYGYFWKSWCSRLCTYAPHHLAWLHQTFVETPNRGFQNGPGTCEMRCQRFLYFQ